MPAPVDPFPDFVPHTLADADAIDARFAALFAALNGAAAGLDELSMASGYHPLDVPQLDAVQARYGTGSLTIPSGSVFASVVVAHGLTRVPVIVLLQSRSAASSPYRGTIFTYTAKDATNITVQGYNLNEYASGAVPSFDWLVIG